MPTRARLAIVLIAAIAVTALTGPALANRLSLSEPDIRAVFAGLRFTNEPPGGGLDAICPVTLEGTFHRATFVKSAGALIGYITRAILARTGCTLSGMTHIVLLNGAERNLSNVVVPQRLPWHIQYDSFSGRLPAIASVRIRIINFAFLFLGLGNSCLYKSTAASPALFDFIIAGGGVTELNAVNTAPIPPENNPFFCPAEMFLERDAEVHILGSQMGGISIHLI